MLVLRRLAVHSRKTPRLLRQESTHAVSATLDSAPATPLPIEAITENAASRTSKTVFAMKKYKPHSPGLRWLQRPVNDHLHKGRPFLPLTSAKRKQGGRNFTGQVTVRHQGGGHKRRLRDVDFKRTAPGLHRVERIEYDPGRSGHLALLTDAKGTKSYILACDGLRAGDTVESYVAGVPQSLITSMGGDLDPGMLAARTIQRGNCLPLHMIPVGTLIHAIGTAWQERAKFCRSAGTYAQVIASPKTGYAVVKLQSGELRRIPANASATVGVVSNVNHHHRTLGKAGRSRWLGIRPTVRGVAMNAYEHPHGGGHGGGRGNKPTQSIWGWKTKGYKTRRSVHNQNKFLVKGRPRGKDKQARS
ncbi:translation protein SH3-like domain-containing protein [Protomyces lactucae-debilis]|uniref:Large ribosomal subunit protein uL2m n=1 Tax=Protomyces lactucae-debilis TaxID=2754530 RepID=A0A1Y2F3E0_PROLT|nr:translation protein SH3-like domain-containing protein [Protomyces lactucae-debilis]ORY78197.1 translation protein SH3-like domain-containing protein [Protomyces lactucae-debilis]